MKVSAKDLSSCDDEALALRARDGDHLAFGEIYRRYYPVVASYVRPRVGGGVADDAIQNVFLALLRGLPGYRGPRFFSWAYRVCVNSVTDELRRQRRRGVEVPSVREDGPSSDRTGGDPTKVPTPEEELIARRLLGRLQGALDRLPEGQRTVFVLARIEGLDYAEISELLGVPVGTIKSRMWKAVRTLLPREGAR